MHLAPVAQPRYALALPLRVPHPRLTWQLTWHHYMCDPVLKVASETGLQLGVHLVHLLCECLRIGHGAWGMVHVHVHMHARGMCRVPAQRRAPPELALVDTRCGAPVCSCRAARSSRDAVRFALQSCSTALLCSARSSCAARFNRSASASGVRLSWRFSCCLADLRFSPTSRSRCFSFTRRCSMRNSSNVSLGGSSPYCSVGLRFAPVHELMILLSVRLCRVVQPLLLPPGRDLAQPLALVLYVVGGGLHSC